MAAAGSTGILSPAIQSEDPYPIKAYIAFRHDPLLALPDPEGQKKALDKLDLLVAIDSNYSETAWYADVLLPSATYLEKSSVLATGRGLKPQFQMRKQAVYPRGEARADWEIFKPVNISNSKTWRISGNGSWKGPV
jgi:thiosulfate reductase/polysulfide reductase chain A